MAEIYLARMGGSDGFSKLVVVKRLLSQMSADPEFVQMFLDEARINARLSHSNIVQVLELGEVDGQYFIAMEYVSGLSVAQVGKLATQRLGQVPQNVACGIILQACGGLHHAHETKMADGTEMGIVHRDVSPQNLLLTYEGFVKVVDFGIAKAEGRATQTRAGMVKGKFAYMSPEQCTGGQIDRRTDIFALGIILFELCTSRRLFKRGSTFETYEAIIKCEVPDPSTVNPAISKQVAAVILKSLAAKKEDRYPTAEAMQEALEVAMRRSGVRGSAMDLSRFIETNFQDQVKEQEDLIRRIEAGELSAPDHQHDAESSKIAENYAAIADDELLEEEEGDGATQNDEGNAKPSAPPPTAPPATPPPVRSVGNQNAPLANQPVSMALPTLDPKKAIADMLSGAAPNVLGDQLHAIARAANIPLPAGRTPSGQVPAPGGPGSSGLTPALSQAPQSGQNPVAARSGAVPPSKLTQLVNLPLPVLIAIGVALMVTAAIVTALIVF
ncbi:MAG: protein kinase [Deltaproteobacteria bacterium]|nr:protein kinase [Deltaproteobacteria bacterium]